MDVSAPLALGAFEILPIYFIEACLVYWWSLIGLMFLAGAFAYRNVVVHQKELEEFGEDVLYRTNSMLSLGVNICLLGATISFVFAWCSFWLDLRIDCNFSGPEIVQSAFLVTFMLGLLSFPIKEMRWQKDIHTLMKDEREWPTTCKIFDCSIGKNK
jgi:hypothetical protein